MENSEFEESVKQILSEVCSEYRLAPTKNLFSSWKKGLSGLSPETILKASEIFMKEERKYLPSSGEFRKFCLQYDADKIIQSRRKETEQFEPLDKPEAKKAYQNITGKLKNRKSPESEKPNLLLYDFLDNEGRLFKVNCKGHVDLNLFNSECEKIFISKPKKSFHSFRISKIFYPKGDSSRYTNSYSAYIDCDPNQKGAEKITVGLY